jgi:hypothetical protein
MPGGGGSRLPPRSELLRLLLLWLLLWLRELST